MNQGTSTLHTCFSPALLDLYEVQDATVVIIDVLRATSTVATALYNGAACVIPVESVARCIELGKQMDCVTAGERDGKIAEGLVHGNSPLEYGRDFIEGKILVLTTTNGTKLLHMTRERGAKVILTGSFSNLSAVCDFLTSRTQDVVLACAAWKNRINMEDLLFAGAVISRIKPHFQLFCDSSAIAEALYAEAKEDLFGYLKSKQATHFLRLSGYGLEQDIRYCLTADKANILPFFSDGKLIAHPGLNLGRSG